MEQSLSEKTYWRCIEYHSHHCHFRLHTFIITNNAVELPTVHTCTFDVTTLERRKFDEQITSRAPNSQETSDIITTHCYKSKGA